MNGRILPAIALTAGAFTLWGGNLYQNASFELKDAGYSGKGYLRPWENPARTVTQVQGEVPHGKNALFLKSGKGEIQKLQLPERKLVPGKTYTFSCWLKSDDNTKVSVQLLSIGIDKDEPCARQEWYAASRSFIAGKTWQRFQFTFTVKPKVHPYFSTFLSIGGKNSAGASVYVDAVQLEESPAMSVFAPASVMEHAAVPQQLVFLDDAPIKIAVRSSNAAKEAAEKELTLSVRDRYTGKIVQTKKLTQKIPANGCAEQTVTLQNLRYGCYTAEISGGIPGYFSRIHALPERKFDLSEKIAVGICNCPAYTHPGTGDVIVSQFGDPAKDFELLQKGGIRLVREFNIFPWSAIEPEKGKFDFTYTDVVFRYFKQHNISAVAIVGNFGISNNPNYRKGLPDWVVKKSTIDNSAFVPWMRTRGVNIYLPPDKDFGDFMTAVTQRYAGVVRFYEFMNEPLFYFPADKYVKYLKILHPIVRKSGGKVLGMCPSSDYASKIDSWTKKAMDCGAMDHSDIMSFHPYAQSRLDSVDPADCFIESLKKACKGAGHPEIKLWNTETYFLNGKKCNTWHAYQNRAYDAAYRFLLDAGEGVTQSIALNYSQIWNSPHHANLHGNDITHYKVPSEIYSAYNTLAYLFEGCSPAAKIRYKNDVICYVYERDGKYSAALWRYDGSDPVRTELPFLPGEVVIYDLFGNVIPDAKTLELDKEPVYFTAKNVSNADFLRKLKSLQMRGKIPLETGKKVRLIEEKAGAFLLLPVRSRLEAAQELVLEIRGDGFKTSRRFFLKPGEEITAKLPVKFTSGIPAKAQARMLFDGKLIETDVTLESCPVLRKEGVTLKNHNGKKKQLAASFRQERRDGKNMLIFTVHDPVKSDFRKPAWWDQDCIELFFDGTPEQIPLRHPELYNGKTTRLFLLPYAPAGEQLQIWPGKESGLTRADFPCKMELLPQGYKVTLTLPDFGNIPMVGMNVQIDSASGKSSREEFLDWAGSQSSNDRMMTGCVLLK